ncbi:MAG: DegV family protein [Bacilli bacterium]|nr:DegV family protein [Bacilli bacterium]
MKENFAILTDAGGDFTREIIEKYGIEETPISTVVWPDGSNRETDIYWEKMTPNEYFTLMTNKKNNFSSSIPSPQTINDRLTALAKAGRNVVVITISSTMSGGYSAFTVGAREVMEQYPEVKIKVIDSLRYSGAIDLIALEASLCREKGMDFDSTVKYLQDFRLRIHQCGFIDDLFFLARKGRIAKGKAFMGNMIGIKPLGDLCNETGQTQIIGKARGYKTVMKLFPEYIKRTIGDPTNKSFVVTYSLREPQALEMKKMIEETFHPQNLIFVPVGQSTGCNVGPGLAAAFYAGDEPVSPMCEKEAVILNELLKK